MNTTTPYSQETTLEHPVNTNGECVLLKPIFKILSTEFILNYISTVCDVKPLKLLLFSYEP